MWKQRYQWPHGESRLEQLFRATEAFGANSKGVPSGSSWVRTGFGDEYTGTRTKRRVKAHTLPYPRDAPLPRNHHIS